MSVPGTPNTDYQPLSFDQAIQFYWDAPTGSSVTEYRLTLNYDGGSLVYTPIPAADVTFIATGLTNNITYSATLEARNAIGYSAIPGTYRDWQPGAGVSGPPVTATATLVGATNAILSWTPPAVSPTAPIYWYVIEAYSTSNPLPIASYSANGLTQSNYFITGLNSNLAYYFNVSAVNYPDYSLAVRTSTIQYLAPFQPNYLPGMSMWLDGRDPLNTGTAPANGTSITTWFDKSGQGYNATSAGTGGVPTYSSAEQTVNVFSSNSFYTTTYSASLSNESIFFVFKMTNANQTSLLGPASPPTGGRAVYVWTAPMWLEAGLVSVGGYTTTTSNSVTYCNMLLGSLTINNNTWSAFINSGNQRASATSGNPTAGKTTNLGYFQYTYELNIYNRPLTPFDSQKVEGYLAWKWGIQSNLPTSHPFRTAAPYSNSVFAPTSFSGLQLWLDAADPNGTGTTPANGAAITSWADKSGYLRNATPYQGSNPVYSTTALNSRACVQFNVNDALRSAVPAGTFPSGVTCYVVFQKTGARHSYDTVITRTTGFSAAPFDMYNTTRKIGAGGGDNTGTSSYDLGLLTSATLYGFNVSPSGWNENLNGSNQINPVTSGTNYGDTAPFVYLGSRSDSFINFRGNMGEVIVYNRILSTGDRQTVEGYLAWKWGLQSNLPVTHPYVLNNPGAVTTNISVATTSLLLRFDASTYSGTGTWSNTGNLGITHNATRLSGTPTKNAAGNGIIFNGATSTLAYTVPNMSAVSTVFTLSTWVKRLPSFSGFSAIFTQDFPGGSYINFMLGPANTNSQVVQVGHFTSAYYLTNSSTMPLNTWFNFTATFDGTIYRLYENGNATTTYTPGVAPVNNGTQYYIGRLWSATYFTGEVGQLLVYNRRLTPAEVLQNYAATSNTFSV